MGNCGLGGHAHFDKQVIKLVHSNGLIDEFYRPVKAGELLIDYPHHFICHADGLSQLLSGRGNGLLLSLSEDDEMDIGNIYFLLPKQMLHATPSRAEVAALMSKATTARKASYKGSLVGPLPLPARHGSSYGYHEDEEEEEEDEEETSRAAAQAFVRRVLAEAKAEWEKRAAANPALRRELGGNPELQSAFANHMVARSCARLWRPPLDTIYEDTNAVMESSSVA